MKREVVVVSGCRTAQGTFGGTLRDVSAHAMAETVIAESIRRAGIEARNLDHVIVGQVYQTSRALNIGRFCVLDGGLPFAITGAAINAACCSSLEAFNSAARDIAHGDSDVVVAAGTENMSNVPFFLHDHRFGMRRGNSELVDMFEESTWSASSDRYGRFNMGMAADHIAKVYDLSRAEQDAYALRSHALAVEAIDKGLYRDEIVGMQVRSRKGTIDFDRDEHPRRDTTIDALAKLRPSFGEGGTVTAGNASGIGDGAAALVLMSRDRARELGVRPLALVKATARVGVDPRLICMSPGPAANAVLKRAGVRAADIGWWEINEAFSSVVLSSCREIGVDWNHASVNPVGGGIALGHPVGNSGARTLVTMLHGMRRTGARYGVATIGGGGGIGTAALLELAE